MHNRSFLIRDAVFWIGLLLAMVTVAIPPLRYLFYITPILVIFSLLCDRAGRMGDEAKPFLILIIIALACLPFANKEGVKDIIFIMAGISLSFLVDMPRLRLWSIFWITMTFVALMLAAQGHVQRVSFDIERSSSPIESGYSFIFGLLAVFALLEKRQRLFFLCLIMCLLTLKRIAFIGALGATFFVWLGEKRGRKILNPMTMVIINLIILAGLLMYGYGAFDKIITQFTGMSANQVGMGRRKLFEFPAKEIMSHPWDFIIFGKGSGKAYELSSYILGMGKLNLHSDVIKIFYEYGLIVFIAFIYFMYSSRNYYYKVAFLYVNILFFSDNVLIYSYFFCVFTILIRYLNFSQKNQIDSENKNLALN